MEPSKSRTSAGGVSGRRYQSGLTNFGLSGVMEARTEIVNGCIQFPLRFILREVVTAFGGREPVFEMKRWADGLTQFTVDFQAPGTDRDQTPKDYSVDGFALSRLEDAENSCAGTALIHLDEKFNMEVVDVSVLRYEMFESRFRTVVRYMAGLYGDIERGEAIWSKAIEEGEEMCMLYQSKVEDNILEGTHGAAEIFVHGILSDLRCIVSGASTRRNSLGKRLKELAKELKDNKFTAARSIAFNNHKTWRRVVKISAKVFLHELAKKLGFGDPVFKIHITSEGVFEAKVKLSNAVNICRDKEFTLKFVGKEMETKDDAEENAALGVIIFLEEQIGFQVSDLHYDARVIAEDNVICTEELWKRVCSAGVELMAGFTDLLTAISGLCEFYENEPSGIYNETITGSEHNIAAQFAVSMKELTKLCGENLEDVRSKMRWIGKWKGDK